MITYAQVSGEFRARRRPPTVLIFLASPRMMADPELPVSTSEKAEHSPWLRTLLWALVGIALVLGIVLFFRYTRHMTPLL
jgi:hypothetical protein